MPESHPPHRPPATGPAASPPKHNAGEYQNKPLKREPAYGVYRWWPEEGEAWIHPFDVGIVRQLIPGDRVFRREDLAGEYQLVTYGDISFRVRPALWYEVKYEGIDVGDYVEIKSQMGKHDPFVGQVRDLIWNQRDNRIDYFLVKSEQAQVRAYRAEEMTLIDALGKIDAAMKSFLGFPRTRNQTPSTDKS